MRISASHAPERAASSSSSSRDSTMDGSSLSARACASTARSSAPSCVEAVAAILRSSRQDLEHVDEFFPVAPRLVDPFQYRRGLAAQLLVLEQAFEGAARARMIGIEEQDLAEILECGRLVGQLQLLRLGQAELQV